MTTTQTRDEREVVPSVREADDDRDIYAVLGVHPSASPRVIQEMYWMRVARLRDAERSGDASAPIEIEALSAALAVAWSPERRAAYDEQRELTGEASTPTRRSPLALVRFPLELLLASLVAAVVLVVHSPTAAALALAGVLAGAAGIRRLRRRPALKGVDSAFALLQLRPTDDIAEIERAYGAVSQTLLARLRHDDAALDELDALDRAFARAITGAQDRRVEIANLSELGDRMADEPATSQATRPDRPAAERRRSLGEVVTASLTVVLRDVGGRIGATATRLSLLVRYLAARGTRRLANVGRATATRCVGATQLGIHWASVGGRAAVRRMADGLVELRSSKPGLRPTTRAFARAARWLVSAALASLRVSRPVFARALRRGSIELRCLPARTSMGAKWSARTTARAWRWSRAREEELRPRLRRALAEARIAVIVGSRGAARFARRSWRDAIRASLAARGWVQNRRDEGIPGHSVTLPPPVDSPSLSTDVRRRLAGMGAAAQPPVRPGLIQSDSEAPTHITCQSPDGVVRVAVSGEPISIGAASTCDLVLDAAFGIAPEHAVLWRRGEDLILHVTTFGATCEVNGKPARWASLDDGDVVAMGEVQLTVERRAELAS